MLDFKIKKQIKTKSSFKAKLFDTDVLDFRFISLAEECMTRNSKMCRKVFLKIKNINVICFFNFNKILFC